MSGIGVEHVSRELDDFLPELFGCAVDRADIIEVKIVAAVGGGNAPGREIAVERNAGADLIRAGTQHIGSDLRRCGFVRLPAVG